MDDLFYEPVGDWLQVLIARPAARVLAVGVPDIDAAIATAVRVATVPRLPLPDGAYSFDVGGEWWHLVVRGGGARAAASAARFDRIEDNHPLAMARQWFDALWDGALVQGLQGAFGRGDVVRILGSDGVGEIVEDPKAINDTFIYRVLVNGRLSSVSEQGLTRVEVAGDDPVVWVQAEPAPARELVRRITLTKVTNSLSDTLYSYGSSKTIIRPYQFKPVLRLIESAHKRILIADEVGLGKTIEAGLIWTELEQRTEVRRVLVVCPAMLVRKWRDEMRRRFGRAVRIMDRVAMEELIDHFRHGETGTHFYGVISLERLRSSDQLADLEAAGPAFDLVIVDEAHYLRNAATASYELGERLSDWSDALVFLSATPLNLGQDDLFNLVNLLLPLEFPDRLIFEAQLEPNALLTRAGKLLRESPVPLEQARQGLADLADMQFGMTVLGRPEFAELDSLLSHTHLGPLDLARAKRLLADLNTLSTVVSRTRRADVPDAKAKREPYSIAVEWTAEERAFYDTVRAWTYARARAKGTPPGFAAQMPLRQTASCIPAMVRRLNELDAEVDDDVDDPHVIGLGEGEDGWNQAVVEELRSHLRTLEGRLGGVDSKYDEFARALRVAMDSGSGQVMVFSFFRRTLEYLAEQIGDEYRCAVMHGGVSVERRERLMDRFRAGELDVLLLSEVGSEGLDFEFCSVLFNYDLPWNPMRVEQRIGRLDRFGQTSEKIHIYNFQVPGTIETEIFGRLYDRLRIFEDSIGELEPVLREEFADLQRLVLDPRLSDEERAAELHRTEVAFHERAEQLEDLRSAEGELIGLDHLIVDGLERDIDRGRYVGREEMRDLVDQWLAAHPGTGLVLDAAGTGELLGSEDLARALTRSQRTSGASKYSLTDLARRLSDANPIAVTLDPAEASRSDRELLSVRHPVVLTAIEHAERQPGIRAARFASCAITGPVPGRYVVLVSLLEVTGLRPTLELWPVSIDLRDGATVDDVGDLLLGAVARGEVSPADEPFEGDLRGPVERARDFSLRELLRIEDERRTSNTALAATRIATIRAETDHKVRRAEETLAKVHSQPSLKRLYEGRIRNLRADETRKVADLESRRELAANLRHVAVIDLTVRPLA